MDTIQRAEEAAVEVTTKASTFLTGVFDKNITIISQQGLIEGSDVLKIIKSAYNKLEQRRKETVKPINDAKVKIQELFKPDLDNYLEAEKVIKQAIIKYQQEQLEKQKEAERLAKIETDKKEATRIAELERQKEEWAKKGNQDKVEEKQEMIEEVFIAPVMPVQEAPQKISGLSTRKSWKARPVDDEYDVKIIPPEYLMVNQKMLDQVAKATKGKLKISGVEFYSEDIISSR